MNPIDSPVAGAPQASRESRRAVIATLLALPFAAAAGACGLRQRGAGTTPQPPPIVETHAGDPDLPEEQLVFRPLALEAELPVLARKEAQQWALEMLRLAHTYVGVSRRSNPEQVTRFLEVSGHALRYSNGQFVPFCAAGVTFVGCESYCRIAPEIAVNTSSPARTFRRLLSTLSAHYFKASPSCREMVDQAVQLGRWMARDGAPVPMPGWLVFFDWKGTGRPQHVGIIDSVSNNLTTVEFNTSATNDANGGAVAIRERSVANVLGYIRTY